MDSHRYPNANSSVRPYSSRIALSRVLTTWAKGNSTPWWLAASYPVQSALCPPSQRITSIISRPSGTLCFCTLVLCRSPANLAGLTWCGYRLLISLLSALSNCSPKVSAFPPLVLISCTNVSGRVHDSTTNIKANKQFSVNIISEPFIQGANFTSVDAPPEQSEWPGSGLTMAPSVRLFLFLVFSPVLLAVLSGSATRRSVHRYL